MNILSQEIEALKMTPNKQDAYFFENISNVFD
jgi:hypothetical protein